MLIGQEIFIILRAFKSGLIWCQHDLHFDMKLSSL